MNRMAKSVLDHLNLKESAEGLFSTVHQNEGWQQVFGGQLMAQSLCAASNTVSVNKRLVSYQSMFSSPADTSKRIDYNVDSIREGRSFSMRQVVAKQAGGSCFQTTILFQSDEIGLNSHGPMPIVPLPHECADLQEMVAAYQKSFPDHLEKLDPSISLPPQAVEMRFVDINRFLESSTELVDQMVWIKFASPIGEDSERHKQVLAYASDQAISHVVAQPHGLGGLNPKLRLVSLDHSMWFHHPFSADDWLLLVRRCQSTTSGRALVTGEVFDQGGTMVASLAQQALAKLVD